MQGEILIRVDWPSEISTEREAAQIELYPDHVRLVCSTWGMGGAYLTELPAVSLAELQRAPMSARERRCFRKLLARLNN